MTQLLGYGTTTFENFDELKPTHGENPIVNLEISDASSSIQMKIQAKEMEK